jgi:hypothetical protein
MAGSDPPALKGPATTTPMRRAVEYVRMSTDHQKYSTENQPDAIRKYAEERGFQLVRDAALKKAPKLPVVAPATLSNALSTCSPDVMPKSSVLSGPRRRETTPQ